MSDKFVAAQTMDTRCVCIVFITCINSKVTEFAQNSSAEISFAY